ncbi:piggyBac transposable element-derived protein 3-like isoform X1 [Nilaparvata lugens]|uniref:piggyBac transposable element-derived protein 3-like isoform X1 n=1 Tax=Nilaparvata lugens TaxID=108931 RepID=UPI00193D701A|nr:piggyBac transposable element-derived protein 3-like isoform X1 [Nilaparvata lugens]
MSWTDRLTVAEIASILEEDEDIVDPTFFIDPPENAAISECDSDDDTPTGNINHLSGNQLRARGELIGRKLTDDGLVEFRIGEIEEEEISQENTEEEGKCEQEVNEEESVSISTNKNTEERISENVTEKNSKKRKQKKDVNKKKKKKVKVLKKIRKWQENDIADKTSIEFTRANFLENDYSPVELFEFFFDNEVVEYIVFCTNLYAREKGNMDFSTSKNEIRQFFSILFLSGYNTMARYRMYWETAEDTHHEAVSSAMSRNRFEDLLRYIHFCENVKIDKDDKFAKVRPVMCMLNERWLQYFPGDVYLSIDESMVPYFGRHGAKQHIHGKPIRFGYKVWMLATRLGYAIQMEPYQGKSTGATNPELGVGGSVVMDLISELPSDRKYCFFFDNFFTSLKLLEELRNNGHYGTGTIRVDRVQGAPLRQPQDLKKEPRGTFHQVTDTDTNITLVRYMDNSVFTMASTATGVQPMGKAKRWSSHQKKHIIIPQPNCVNWYNLHMGGVDRLDENVAAYRINIRNKKWYWPIIAYLLNVSMNNAWLLYRMTQRGVENKLDLLGFTRYIVRTYLQTCTTPRPSSGRPSMKVSNRVLPEVRFSGKDHFLETVEKQVRCALCSKATRKKCKICKVGCHVLCAEAFHTR